MNKTDTARLLVTLSRLNNFHKEDEASVVVWQRTLDQGMTLEWAQQFALDHYGKSPDFLGTDKFNAGWHEFRKSQEQIALAAGVTVEERVPMPDWFKKAMLEGFGHADLDHLGESKKSGAEIQEIFDRYNPGDADLIREGIDRHCQRSGCRCHHTGECYKGWLPSNQGENRAVACPNCRGDLSDTLTKVRPLGSRTDVDQFVIQNRHRGVQGDHTNESK